MKLTKNVRGLPLLLLSSCLVFSGVLRPRVCGDAILNSDLDEECDDGNNQGGDGCSDICEVEICGDSVLAEGEECDDGNQVESDDCLSTCKTARCGDGFIQAGRESCEPPGVDSCAPDCLLICEQSADCLDQNACTINERCEQNRCLTDLAPTDDQNACTVDSCNPETGVLHTLVDLDDGDECTDDLCDPQSGIVSHSLLSVINDQDACTIDTCDPQNGVITHTAVDLDDDDACTIDSCDPQAGVFHLPISPDDQNACTVDSCNSQSGVSHTAINVDDNNACTADLCDPASGIFHLPHNLDDSNACTVDSCHPLSGIAHTPVLLDDANACTADSCHPLFGVSHAPVSLDDDNPCTTDSCDVLSGVGHAGLADGASCNIDQNAATREICRALICVASSCGDSFIDVGANEQCDGSVPSGKSCIALGFASGALSCQASTCQLDTSNCVPFPSCGDGAVDNGEECDDGNQNNTDACLQNCQLASCGDNFVRAGIEDCDDANTNNNDACLNTCQNASCGDGFVQSGIESCDDTNSNNTDACLNTCQLASCGDGFIRSGTEECDDNNQSNTDACLNTCQFAECGDSFVRAGVEGCDDGNTSNTDACLNACQLASCGDGFIRSGVEQCDDTNQNNVDSCLTTCQLASCGDGFIRAGIEDCDDTNQSNTDACLDTCQFASCGDGFVRSVVEDCDGAALSGESCTSLGFSSGALSCEANSCLFDTSSCVTGPVCGNGILDSGEECDDDNTSNNDGCSSSCQLEADEFVLCDGGTGGNGDLGSPFHQLNAAISNSGTIEGETVMILPQSPQSCSGATISKSLLLQGLAAPSDPSAPARPVIDGGGSSALLVSDGDPIQVIVKNLEVRSNAGAGTVISGGKVQLALLGLHITNTLGVGVDCNTDSDNSNEGVFFLDQSEIKDNPDGGVRVRNKCRAVLANSLFQGNGTGSGRGAIKSEGSKAEVAVLYSTFDNNQSQGPGAALSCSNAGNSKIDSSILNDNNVDSTGQINAPIGAMCTVSFTNTFGFGPPAGTGNLNLNPIFVTQGAQPFHLGTGSPCINAANPSFISLPFNPLSVFGINLFTHDFAGNLRSFSAGSLPDMGMFEEP